MTDRIISVLSLLSLLYFAYGTWRIDRSTQRMEDHLARIREILTEWEKRR